MQIIKIGVLTVSDRCFAGTAEDKSGNEIHERIRSGIFGNGFIVAERDCVPDEISSITNVLTRWSDDLKLELIITTGGTGLAKRDVTPEATKSILHKEAAGISTALIQESLKSTPMAMLSRLTCGIRKNSLIINFPGSSKACAECLDVIKHVVKHAVDLVTNNKEVDEVHKSMAGVQACMKNVSVESKVNANCIARRDRISPYPMIEVENAQSIILRNVSSLSKISLNINDALGYVACENIEARESFPPFPASVKDGYAVITSDGAGVRSVISSSIAGNHLCGSIIRPGECVRITTGAPVPEGADAVVQIEDTVLILDSDDGNTEVEIEILKPPRLRQDIREIGSDIEMGSILVQSGVQLTSSQLGVLATAGITNVTVFRKPEIAVLSTGNELQPLGEVLEPGKIRDSNKITLLALLKENGFSAVDYGIALDNPNSLLQKIRSCLSIADVLITTGGVSMGEKDLLTDVLIKDLSATLHFGRINMKPGKPTKFFTVPITNGKKIIFALPGNPVSAAVTSHLFVFPALRAMSGVKDPLPQIINVKIDTDVKLDDRYEYARASLKWIDGDVLPSAHITGNQISSRLMNMVTANCLLHLPVATESKKTLAKGDIIKAQFLRSF